MRPGREVYDSIVGWGDCDLRDERADGVEEGGGAVGCADVGEGFGGFVDED